MDCSLPGSSVLGILQARILECVAIPFSRASSQPRDWTQVSCIADRSFTIWAIRKYVLHIPAAAAAAAAAAKSLQSCPTLWDPIDGSPTGFPIPGILQARTLKWVAISFSNAWKWTVKVKSLSRVRLLATPWTAAHQAPPSMGFSRQEYWSGVPLPSPLHFPALPKRLWEIFVCPDSLRLLYCRDLLGGPVAKTPSSQFRRPGFDLWLQN